MGHLCVYRRALPPPLWATCVCTDNHVGTGEHYHLLCGPLVCVQTTVLVQASTTTSSVENLCVYRQPCWYRQAPPPPLWATCVCTDNRVSTGEHYHFLCGPLVCVQTAVLVQANTTTSSVGHLCVYRQPC